MNYSRRKAIVTLSVIAAIAVSIIYSYFAPNHSSSGLSSTPSDCQGCNVVVIVIDTLRADHLPSYGYQHDTAPFLTSLFEKSTLFERAYSASSWTAPATASLFTAQLPSTHGIIMGFLASRRMMKDGIPLKMNKLPKEVQTLGEYMASLGYRTAAVTDNLNIGTEMGFDRGFELFKKHREKGSKRVNKTATTFLEQLKDKGPYFLYLHYMDPHAPYEKQNPYYDACFEKTSGSEQDSMICAYDSEIRYLDQNIAKLFEANHWLENSIVFITADHGEELWDHGDRGHGSTLYRELIHVPFAVYHPKWAPHRVATNVQSFDLLPTIAGIHSGPTRSYWQGVDLSMAIKTKAEIADRPMYSERLRDQHSKNKWWKRSVVSQKWHYILTEEPEKPSQDELYDLSVDFSEQDNIVKKAAEITKKLSEQIALLPPPDAVEKRSQEEVEVKLDPELANQLRTLGYLD